MNDVGHPKALYEACQRRGIVTDWETHAVWRLLYRVSGVLSVIVVCWLLFFFLLVASNDHDPHGVLPMGTTSRINLMILAILLGWVLWVSIVYGFFRAEGPLKAHWGRWPTVVFFPLMMGVLALLLSSMRAIIKWVARSVIDALYALPPPPPPPGVWPPAPPTLPTPPHHESPTPDAGTGLMAVYYLLLLLPAFGIVYPFVTFLLNVMLCKPSAAAATAARATSIRNVKPIRAEL